MSTTSITRRLEIDAGHRLLRHEGKCRHAHGHRYVFDVTCEADRLDEVGRVVDFSVVKELVGGWLDRAWDHAFIAQEGDPIIEFLSAEKMRHYVLDAPPTAEHLARVLRGVASTLLAAHGIRVARVRCWETPNCWADYAP